MFQYVTNDQLPAELYITFQTIENQDTDQVKKTKILSLGKKEDAAILLLLKSIGVEK